MKKFVIDTSYLLRMKKHLNGEIYLPPEVLEEIKSTPAKLKLSSIDYSIKKPSIQYVKKIKETSTKLGAILSKADIAALALALELNAVLLTNDFTMQNIAKFLGIKYTGNKTIKKIIRWVFICPICGKEYHSPGECERCGVKLERRVSHHKNQK